MQGIDKLRKVLIIIFTTLSIIALVFTLCKKIGLCAGSSQNPISYGSFPLPYGVSTYMGFDPTNTTLLDYLSNIDYDYAIDYGISQGLPSDIDTVVIQEVGSRYLTLGLVKSNGISYVCSNSNDVKPMNTVIHYNYRYLIRYDMQSGNYNFSFWGGFAGDYTCDLTNSNIHLPDGSISSGVFIINYPIYSKVTNLVSNTDDKILFSPSSHSTGGGLTDYSVEVQDFIDSNVNGVDTTAPSDSTNTPSWLQKILNGLGSLNNTIGGGFSWVKKGLNAISGSKLFTFFGAFHDLGDNGSGFSISTFLGNLFFTTPSTLQIIFDSSETGQVINDMKSVVRSIYNCYTATPSDHVYWTFDFSNTILGNAGVITIDFDWYNSIRTPVITLFSVFFILGFIFLWLRKLPGIISGASSNSDDK